MVLGAAQLALALAHAHPPRPTFSTEDVAKPSTFTCRKYTHANDQAILMRLFSVDLSRRAFKFCDADEYVGKVACIAT